MTGSVCARLSLSKCRPASVCKCAGKGKHLTNEIVRTLRLERRETYGSRPDLMPSQNFSTNKKMGTSLATWDIGSPYSIAHDG
jgi:hypothetical protein